MTGFEPACGSCAHCDQTRSGTRRICEIKKQLVDCLRKPCRHYIDTWEQDLFGNFPVYEKLKAKGKAK